MSRARSLNLLLIVAFLLLVPTLGSAEKTTLTIFSMPHAGYPEMHAKTIEAWNKAHPDEQIELELVTGWDSKFIAMCAGGTPPDIIYGSSSGLPTKAAQGLHMSLDELYARSELDTDQWFPPVLDGLKYKGKIYAVPASWSAVGLLYNATRFQEKGLPAPTDLTWEDLVYYGKQLTYDSNGDGEVDRFAFSDYWNHHHRWPIWIYSAGGKFWNEDWTECQLDSPEALKGWNFFMSLYLTEKITPPAGLSHSRYNELFANGDLAMLHTTSYSRPSSEFFQYGVAPTAKGPAGRASVMVVDYLAIHPDSDNIEMAWKLLQFYASEEGYSCSRTGDPLSYFWALPPGIDQCRNVLIDRPDTGAEYWAILGEVGKRSEVSHPVVSVHGLIDWGKLADGALAPETALLDAVKQANAVIQEKLAAGESW